MGSITTDTNVRALHKPRTNAFLLRTSSAPLYNTPPRSKLFGNNWRKVFMLLKTSVVIISLVCAVALAHLYRFVPLSYGEDLKFQLVWDRWFQRVCVVSFAGANQVSCSMEAFTEQFPDSNNRTSIPLSDIERGRQAGFSELEILKYVEKELKDKRQEGMSDADLAVHLFGTSKEKSR